AGIVEERHLCLSSSKKIEHELGGGERARCEHNVPRIPILGSAAYSIAPVNPVCAFAPFDRGDDEIGQTAKPGALEEIRDLVRTVIDGASRTSPHAEVIERAGLSVTECLRQYRVTR